MGGLLIGWYVISIHYPIIELDSLNLKVSKLEMTIHLECIGHGGNTISY